MIYVQDCYRVEAFGGYRLAARKLTDTLVQVKMYDLGAIRFPLVWSTYLTREQAQAAFELFQVIGYFEKPIHTEEA